MTMARVFLDFHGQTEYNVMGDRKAQQPIPLALMKR